MEHARVQDLIRACRQQVREEFCSWLQHPVLICESPRAGLSFSAGQTVLTRTSREVPLARELIRKGPSLPYLLVRQRLPGPPGQIRIGRAPENDLVFRHNTVSSRHATLQQNPRTGSLSLNDLASTNGTHVNGSRLVVGKQVVLFDGDVLGFGDLCFLFFYPGGLYDVLWANLESL